MQINTVDELVAYLKHEGVKFEMQLEAIRATDVYDGACDFACPLIAALPVPSSCMNRDAEDGASAYGLPYILACAVAVAADNCDGHDPSIRAKLLTLVQ